jgi:hypothetical protein
MTIVKTLASTFVAAVAASLICSPAYAQFTFTFDENGNACVGVECTPTLVGTLEADPTGRVAGNVLVYTLPETVLPGDVGIAEFGTGVLSDVLTFTNDNQMIFYSELGGGDEADSGLPTGVSFIGATESADGSFTYDVGNIYLGSSPEGVPEPVTLSLFGAGLVGAAALRRRRKKS